MAARIPVALERNPYEIVVGNGLLKRTGELMAKVVTPGKCAVITDSNVGPIYGERCKRGLQAAGFETIEITVPAGETSKSLAMLEEVCDKMIAAGLDRKASVVALGGGVVGDLAGFAAATYYRGIPYVQVPTTVMAQADSSIGGKTGVNSKLGKNLIGAFHQPALVVTDPEVLKTLPTREFNEGFAEIVKHAAIRDAGMLDETAEFESSDLSSLILKNVKIKALVVTEDEFETKGTRALLNFGHTIGHAIENVAGYGEYLHGEAISLGLICAIYLSVKKAGLPLMEAERAAGVLRLFDLPVRVPKAILTADILKALQKDKKFEGGAIRFVLVPSLGQAFVSKDVSLAEIEDAVNACRDGGKDDAALFQSAQS